MQNSWGQDTLLKNPTSTTMELQRTDLVVPTVIKIDKMLFQDSIAVMTVD
jgi:hypothetical protein